MSIYKTRNTGTGNGMWGTRGTRGMFTKIPRNLLEDLRVIILTSRGMFQKIPGNVQIDSVECSRRFRRMLKNISGNLNLDLFCEILLIFYQILQLKCEKTKEYFLRY